MNKQSEQALFYKVEDLKQYISESLALSRTHMDNRFGDGDAGASYDYFAMRATQVEIFHEIAEILLQIEVTVQKVSWWAEPTFKAIGKSYAKDNDAKALMQQVKETLDIYRTSDLPKTREEFGDARLSDFTTNSDLHSN